MKKTLYLLFAVCLILLFSSNGRALEKKTTSDQLAYQRLLAQMNQSQSSKEDEEKEKEKEKPSSRGWALGCEGNDILSLRMKLTGFTLDILGRLQLDISKPSGADSNMFNMYAGCRFVKVFADGKKVRLNIFAGGIIETITSRDAAGAGAQRQSNLYAIAGFAPEFFIANNFSLETTAGAQMAIIGDDSTTAGNDGRITLGTYGDNINLTAGLAFHCYF